MDLCMLAVQLLLLITTQQLLSTTVYGFLAPEPNKCHHTHSRSLLKISCYDMKLTAVPQNLKSSVQVLDLSFNRIKRLKVSSFEKYRSIKYLLLYENMIMNIEPGTFSQLTSLEEIDLANNALRTIPLEIFQLPSLRNLYIGTNELDNLSHDLESLEKPIKAPLQYLNVADSMLTNLPDLGVLPHLWQINASRNPLNELTLDNFARMCSLGVIDLTITAMNDCTCQQVNQHMLSIGGNMKFVPVCKGMISEDECPSPLNQTMRTAEFAQCKNIPIQAKVTRFWLFVAGCVGGVLLVLALVACCVYRRRRRKRRTKAAKVTKTQQKHLVISPKNAINNRDTDNHLLKRDEV